MYVTDSKKVVSYYRILTIKKVFKPLKKLIYSTNRKISKFKNKHFFHLLNTINMTENSSFTALELEIARMAKCLSHPARIQIICILAKYKDRTCKELVAELPLSQSTVSKHLNDLLEEKLICRKFSGTQSLYTLEWNSLERIFTIFDRLNKKTIINRPKRNCC